MPRLRDITVRVTDAEGHDFEEWGVQQLRKQNKVSAYITSRSEAAFRITIQPKIPFLTSQIPMVEEREVKRGFDFGDSSTNSNAHRGRPGRRLIGRFSPRISPNNNAGKGHSYNPKENVLPPLKEQSSNSDGGVPPFDLLASLYLDGRRKPERRVIVYLDPRHQDFPRPDGKVRFKSRWVQGEHGAVEEHAWVFKDVGIETVFDKMLIAESHNSDENVDGLDEEAMITAMNATELSAASNMRSEEKNGIGQIVIVLERINVGVKWSERNYRPKHRNGQADDVDMHDLGNNITHTTKPTYSYTRPAGPINLVNYWPYRGGEEPYAIFQFFYRSRETLEKFNFPGYRRMRKIPTTNQLQLERKLINMTPLSIAYSLRPSKPPTKTFEQHIKEKSFQPKQETKYQFKQHYREAVAVKEKNQSACHLKRRASRSDAASLQHMKGHELHTRNSAKQKPETSELHQKEMTKPFDPPERAEMEICAPKSPPHTTKTETPMTGEMFNSAPPSKAPAIPEHSPSPFANIGPDFTVNPRIIKSGSLFKAQSTVPGPSAYLKSISKDFREASDADDERDESGKETESEDEDLGKDISVQEDNVANRDRDDGGLHVDFKEVVISKKRHISNDDGVDGYQSGEHGGSASSSPKPGTNAEPENPEAGDCSLTASQASHVTGEAKVDESRSMAGSLTPGNDSYMGKKLEMHQPLKRVKM